MILNNSFYKSKTELKVPFIAGSPQPMTELNIYLLSSNGILNGMIASLMPYSYVGK